MVSASCNEANAGVEAVGITISPDGTHLYVSHYGGSDTVSVIDTATNSVVDTLAVGHVPEYLAMGPAPVIATADRAHVDLHDTLSVNALQGVLANDTDPLQNDRLTVSAVNGQAANVGHALAGAYGTLTLNADGSYTHLATQLPADGVGIDTFTYTAKDGAGVSAATTLTIVVTDVDKTYFGGIADVTIKSPKGHDAVLDGGAGNDVVVAGGPGTVLIGGPGDTLTGSKGSDTFVFASNFGQNTITNFNFHNDTLVLPKSEFPTLAAVFADAHQVGPHTVVIEHDAHDVITLQNLSLSQLHNSDILLV